MSSTLLKQQLRSTPLQGANASFVEALYESYLEAPGSVPDAWRRFFSELSDADDVAHGPIVEALGKRLKTQGAPPPMRRRARSRPPCRG
jgi:2-oxoglutarate dehydrogenase E1 component